jgi:predicted PhzF superfamily epimerase YddE/YHI9
LIDVSQAKEALNILKPARPPQGVLLDPDFSPSTIGTHFYCKVESQDPSIEKYKVRRVMSDGTEDPATGSAASALAGYLSTKEGKSESNYRYEMVQGVEMGRVSFFDHLKMISDANIDRD